MNKQVSEYMLDGAIRQRLAEAASGAVFPDVSVRLLAHWALKLVLLNETVQRAVADVPHYRGLFAQLPSALRNPQSLAEFESVPTLSKTQIAEAPERFVSEAVECNAVRCTSGTSGKRLNVPGCREETEAWQARQATKAAVAKVDNGSDLILRILPPMRRIIGSAGECTTPQMLAIYDYDFPNFQRFDFEDFIAQCLLEPAPLGPGRHVTLLHITPPFLFEVLTTRLVARGFDASSTTVRAIILTGGPVTQRLRNLADRHWNCPIVTAYSCTEINGEARACAHHAGRFHFDETIHAEIVDPVTGAAVPPGGDGKLLLTSMHPYQQAMPLLRYDVNDIVRRHPWPCGCGSVGETIEVLGRKAHCVSLRSVLETDAGPHVIGSLAVEEALSGIPSTHALPYPRFRFDLEDSGVRSPRLTLDVEVQTVAAQNQDALRGRIAEAVSQRVPFLRPLLDANRLKFEIRLHYKGDLVDHFKLLRDR